jgi:hypothetical protein
LFAALYELAGIEMLIGVPNAGVTRRKNGGVPPLQFTVRGSHSVGVEGMKENALVEKGRRITRQATRVNRLSMKSDVIDGGSSQPRSRGLVTEARRL